MDFIKVEEGKQEGLRESAGRDVTALIGARNLLNEDMIAAKRNSIQKLPEVLDVSSPLPRSGWSWTPASRQALRGT